MEDRKFNISYVTYGNNVGNVRVGSSATKEITTNTINKEAASAADAVLKKFASKYPNLVMEKVARLLTEPLRQFLDVATISRQILIADHKNEGEMAYYDLDVYPLTNAVTFGLDGNPTLNWIRARRYIPRYFIISAIAKIPLDAMKWFRYDIVTRAKDRIKQAVAIKEDLLTLSLLTSAAVYAGNNYESSTPLVPQHIGKMLAKIESVPLPGWGIIMHPYALGSIRSWTHDTIDEVARVEIRSTGYIGGLYGLNMYFSKLVPTYTVSNTLKHYVYVITAPEFIGRMPIWADAEVYASNTLDAGAVGFLCWEMLGMLVHNPRGITGLSVPVETL